MDGAVIERDAVRAILITPAGHVLLMRIRPPGEAACFWITPGGGIEAGETLESALRRELNEELGLDPFELGPLVWLRQHTFPWDGRRIRQSERYYVVHVEPFEPRMSDAIEARILQEFRWWHASELALADEPLVPLSLATIVGDYLTHCAPRGPLELEVPSD
jgi:8-oxo-dGTP pyrophosphatase MutT (NUDIX family)